MTISISHQISRWNRSRRPTSFNSSNQAAFYLYQQSKQNYDNRTTWFSPHTNVGHAIPTLPRPLCKLFLSVSSNVNRHERKCSRRAICVCSWKNKNDPISSNSKMTEMITLCREHCDINTTSSDLATERRNQNAETNHLWPRQSAWLAPLLSDC